jgi:tungstate transport system substrate-binding protein
MAEGLGVKRFDVMYNDFVVIGPSADPAHIAGGKNVVEAFRKIADEKAPFISRGDGSGTNEAELRYWKYASIAVNPAQDRWYRENGQGMGPALNMAASADAYVLSDRGTWLSAPMPTSSLIAVLGCPSKAFVDWLISPDAQSAIAEYKIGGKQLFFPDAQSTAP